MTENSQIRFSFPCSFLLHSFSKNACMHKINQLLCVFLTMFFVAACAKETSKEERKREETERQYRRMQKAEGHYAGFVAIDGTRLVPLSLDLTTNRNPKDGGDNPTLSASVRIGMFGGIVVSSNAVSFDWGNGRFSVSLAKQKLAPDISGTAPLEIRGVLVENAVSDGVIEGPISGSHAVSLAKDGPNLFTEQDHYNYQTQVSDVALAGDMVANSQLSLKRLTTPHLSPSTSDLPSLPAFDASIRFANLGVVPQVATDVLYDPILGFVELQFGANTVLRVDNLYLNRDVLSMSLADWKPDQVYAGNIVHGAAVYGHIKIGSDFPSLGLTDAVTVPELPPKYFVGTYKGPAQNARTLTAIASLDYQNTRGTNSAEFPFSYFPNFKLKVMLCDGPRRFSLESYDLSAMDQIRSMARFQNLAGGFLNGILDVRFTPGWKSLEGKLKKEGSTGSIDARDPQLKVAAQALSEFECSAVSSGT